MPLKKILRTSIVTLISTIVLGMVVYTIYSVTYGGAVDKNKTTEEQIDELAVMAEAGPLSDENENLIDELYSSSNYQTLILSYEEYEQLMEAVDTKFVNSILFITAASTVGSPTIYITIDTSRKLEGKNERQHLEVEQMNDSKLELYLLKNGPGNLFNVARIKSRNGHSVNIVTIFTEEVQ